MSYDPYENTCQAPIKTTKRNSPQKKRTYKKQLNLQQGSAKQQEGSKAEQAACIYLRQHGLSILAQNIRCKLGEIDIVALDNDSLVFIEVRKRQNTNYGGAAASISTQKRYRIIRTANYFLPILYLRLGTNMPCRFDVIAIDGTHISWIKHAFSA